MSESPSEPYVGLQRRMRLAALALVVMLSGSAVLGWLLLDAVDVEHQELAYGAAQELSEVDALAVALHERSANARAYLLSKDTTFLEARQAASDAFEARFRSLRERRAGTPRATELEHIEALWKRLDAASDRAVAAVRHQGQQAAIAIWEEHALPLQAEIADSVAELVAAQRAHFEVTRAEAQEGTVRGRRALAALVIALSGALAVLLWVLLRTSREVFALATKEQEQTLFRVLDQVPVGIFVVDHTGKPYYANQWSQRLLGRSARDVGGLSQLVKSYAAFEAGSDTPYPTDRTPLARALQGESSEVTDMEIRRADDVVPLHVRGGPIYGADGELAFAVAAFQDVRELHDAAMRDPLTGLGNRRALSQSFVRERLLQERAGGGLALAMLDLDRFKMVNDTHGHAVGDTVLKRTAAVLVHALRRTDLVIRWGGEELVVVLPDVDLPGARGALQKALAAVRSESFVGKERSVFHVTFSGGLVMAHAGESLESAVARADALLYAAKRAGRDRIVTEDDAAPVG